MTISQFTVKIKAVFFDLDGVLVDTYKVWFRLFNQSLIHFGYKPITLKTFAQNWGQSTEEDVRIFMPEVKLKDVKRYFSINFPKFTKYMKVNLEAKIVLSKLKEMGLRIGCITNSHRDITKLEIKKAGLKNFFDVVVTADDVKRPKPEPDMLLKACKRLRVKVNEVVFIGDTQTDLKTAEKAGCLFIGYRMQSELRIKKLSEIIPLIHDIPYGYKG
jgi:HAD superfamily hydrolase (TIGR01509 family)